MELEPNVEKLRYRVLVQEMFENVVRNEGGRFNYWKLVSPNGVQFLMSIQAHSWAYSHPREDLPRLVDYEEVELAFFPEAPVVGSGKNKWYQPSTVGIRLEDSPQDNVFAYVPLKDLKEALVQFFLDGGKFDK